MAKNNIEVKRMRVYPFVIGALALVLVIFLAFTSILLAEAEEGNDYDTNDMGLSYGSAADAISPEHEPDLIRVAATNGEIGYVYKMDLDAAERAATTLEEADQIMEEFFDTMSDPFHEALDELIDDPINQDVAEDLLFEMFDSGIEEAAESLAENTDLSEQSAELALSEAYMEAMLESGTSIPVYAVDGQTVIGEFIVG